MSNVRIKDIANLCGVAKSTISNVFTGKKYVSDEIKNRVLTVCRELNFKPNFAASILGAKKTGILGLFLTTKSDCFESFYTDVIAGIGLTAAKKDYSIMLYFNTVSDSVMHGLLESKMGVIDGAIILTPQKDDFRAESLRSSNIPYSVIGMPFDYDDKTTSYVDVDNKKCVFELTSSFIRQNRKKILFFNSEKQFAVTNYRLQGFKQALEENGIEFDERYVYNVSTRNSEAGKLLKSIDFPYDAILTESDIVAKEIYEAIGGDIKSKKVLIAATGGNEVAELLDPPLTTVKVNYNKLGEKAFELIYDMLVSEDGEQRSYMLEDINIIYRESSIV